MMIMSYGAGRLDLQFIPVSIPPAGLLLLPHFGQPACTGCSSMRQLREWGQQRFIRLKLQ